MAANTLTDKHREALLEWLCEGLSDQEILERLQTDHDVGCAHENIAYYRRKWRDEIDEGEQRRLEAAQRHGWGLASKRAGVLAKTLTRFAGALTEDDPAVLAKSGISKEFRDLLGELRRELGQDKPQKLLISGELDVGVRFLEEMTDDELAKTKRSVAAAIGAGGVSPGTDPGGEGG